MAASALHVVGTAEPTGEDQRPVLDLRLKSLNFGDELILGAVDLQVPRGQTLALVGPSGIGKSTLLRVFAGLHQDFRGQCDVHGTCAMVFQEPALLPWRDLTRNITVAANVSDVEAQEALKEVGLADRAADFPGQLSLGQQRRLSLARAFAVKPDLLLLDEPFVSLDPPLAFEMMDLFVRLRDAHKVTTVLVTHVTEEARRLASRIVTLGGTPAVIHSDV